jgi:23S rRNA (uracil1939-C5)-methyltransferase
MNQIITDLHIESLAYGGNGLGYHEGKVVFVPQTAPGDRVSCRVIKSKKRFAEAQLEKVLQPSADRCPPACPVFEQCGGCQWQHLPYEVQGDWKGKIFADLLHRQAGAERAQIRRLVAAPEPWHYRSRAQLKLQVTDRQLNMGFYRRSSHVVVDHQQCPILHPRLNQAAKVFRKALNGFRHCHRMPQLDLGIGDDGQVRAVLHYQGTEAAAVADFLRPRFFDAGISLFLQLGRKSKPQPVCGEDELCIRVGKPPLTLAYGPGGFAQVNLEQNRAMTEMVVNAVQQCGARRVLDLYCGMGNLSLPVAHLVDEVIGVEDFAPAIAKARANAQRNGINNAFFHHLSADGAASKLSSGPGFDLVMLDPPRSGAYGVVKELQVLRPRHILYVSCEPPTLARDLQPLLQDGYGLEWSQPFDFFPQTHHIESVSLLRRKSEGV